MFNLVAGKSIVACAAILLLPGALLANGLDVRDFSRPPAFAYASLAPGGAHVSYVDQLDGRQVVMVRTLTQSEPQATLSAELPNERIRWCAWADDRYVLCGTTITRRKQHMLQERTKLYSIDSSTGRVLELNTRIEAAPRDQVINAMPARDRLVLLQQDVDGRGYPEVVELDVSNGKQRLVVRSHPPIRSWMTDERGDVRVGLAYGDGRAALFVRRAEEWIPAIEQALTDPEAVGPLALGETPSELYVLKHRSGRAALFRLDLEHVTSTLLFSDPMFDVSGPVELDPRTRELLAVRYQREGPAVHVFADREREQRTWLSGQLPNSTLEIVSRSLDNSTWLVLASSDTNPPSLYIADVREHRVDLLGHQYPELEGRVLAPMRSIMYAARDGQRIPAYLTRSLTPLNAGSAVVLPHGGPETRDVRTFDPLVQLLAARGFAVLQMNYRGSLGYGAGFTAAGAQQWGGVVHNDITDGARWLIQQGIADPERICIVGASFGGYAALLGAARESQWYACAASVGGPSDLLAFSEFTRRLPDADVWRQRLGDDARALWQMSPMAFARRFETPVLLLHGRRDAVVPLSQSRRLARVLREAGKEHRLLELADCDHLMTAATCRATVFDALSTFLQETIGDSS